MKILSIFAFALFFAGCSAFPVNTNNKSTSNNSLEGGGFTSVQAAQVATDTTDFLKLRYPPAKTVFNYKNSNGLIGKALQNALRAAGYGMVDSPVEGSQELAFYADSVGSLRYVSFSVGKIQLNRIYRVLRDGSLRAGSITEKQFNTSKRAVKPPAKRQQVAKAIQPKRAVKPPAKRQQVAKAIQPKRAVKPPVPTETTSELEARLRLAEIELRKKEIDAEIAKMALEQQAKPAKKLAVNKPRFFKKAFFVPAKKHRKPVLVAAHRPNNTRKNKTSVSMLPAPGRNDIELAKVEKLAREKNNFSAQVQLMAGLNKDDLERNLKIVRKKGLDAKIIKLKKLSALRVFTTKDKAREVLSSIRSLYNDAYLIGG